MTARPGGPRLLLRGTLALLSLTVVALPFAATWRYDALRRAVAPQAPAPAAEGKAAGAPAPGRAAAPVVLAYHDIGAEPTGRYAVSPERFDAHLRALRAAGYRTLSTAEFTGYLRTGRTPAPRTVYLTFDDGTHGLWTHADPILKRHGAQAAAYLITGKVGTHRPYYLSWAETERMARSGRWDFQAHTDDSHVRAPVDAAGRRASVLSNRIWLPAAGRRETVAEYRRRIAADLDRSITALTDHGLPRPELFAMPFSEVLDRTNLGPDGAATLRSLLRERFTAALTNSGRRPAPPGRRAAAAGFVQRLEITPDTGAEDLLKELAHWAPRRPADAGRPLRQPGDWHFGSARGVGLGALTGAGPYPRDHYVWADHLPLATADWTAYRLRATVTGLRGGVTGASVLVRAGSQRPVVLSVGHGAARLTGKNSGRAGRSCELRAAAEHRLEVSVSPERVRATVDGRPCATLRSPRAADPAAGSGGFSLAVRNERADGAWPAFTSLTVE
ncbi:polysaccharide deacetylase family protein [Streptomyces sp. NPDC023723]|uniref:polysaccharide deacetylase family protein n=1 Tax=Streptomyces sp. NPDC023723 TaxID=3154323 RepID=UPI0033C0D9C2